MGETSDEGPLDTPIEEDFRVGTMALAWDPDTSQVIIEAQEATAEEEEDPIFGDPDRPEPAVLRVRISAAAARAFSRARSTSWPPAARPARCAGNPSIPRVTSASGSTDTTPGDSPHDR